MSVQFAQQTEMARVSRDEQDKSNTCRVTEESQTEMEPIPKQDLQFDTERNKMEELFSEEKGEFQRELTQKNTEALSVERQMQNVKIVYKLGTHDVISEADLQEEFLNAEQELFRDFCATGNSNLKEMSLQCKMEINEFENQELAQVRSSFTDIITYICVIAHT